MAVNLSALAGAGQQFFDNNGNPLTGGKLWSYQAGTTTPQTTYTDAAGAIAHTNPIILDSAGRVATGEIWLTAGNNYKFVLMTSANTTLATWDNITGINGTGITSNAINVQYDPAGIGAVTTNVQSKLREFVSVEDFGAVGDGVTDDRLAIQNAIDSIGQYGTLNFSAGKTYIIGSPSNPTGLIVSQRKQITINGNGAKIQRGFGQKTFEGHTLEFLFCDNVVMRNIDFDGKNEVWGGAEIQSHNVAAYGCTFVKYENVNSSYAICDGFLHQKMSAGTVRWGLSSPVFVPAKAVVMINCQAEKNARQGMTGGSMSTFTAINCTFRDTGKSTAGNIAPAAGVDIEPNASGIDNKAAQVTFIGCSFSGNFGAGCVVDYRNESPLFINCIFEKNGSMGLGSMASRTSVQSCVLRGNGVNPAVNRAQAGTVMSSNAARVPISWQFDNCLFEDSEFGDFACDEGIGVKFRNCNFVGGNNFGIRVANSATYRHLGGVVEIDNCKINGKSVSATPPTGVAFAMLSGLQVPVSIKNLTIDQSIQKRGTTTIGSATVTNIVDTQGLSVGMVVSGSGIVAGSVVLSIAANGDAVTLDNAATASGSGVVLSFTPASAVPRGLIMTSSTDINAVVGVDIIGTYTTAHDGLLSAKTLNSNKLNGVSDNAMNGFGTYDYAGGTLAAGEVFTSSPIVFTGAAFGDFVRASLSVSTQGATVSAYVSAANRITVQIINSTASPITIAASTVKFKLIK